MENELISIIVPVYNVEKYISRCLNSIIAQTYKNIEIIIVDDGSPDSCCEICDEYAGRDKRIRVIHQKNGGLSNARNTGIKNANGAYLSFIDSDDFISEYFIEILYRAIKRTGAFIASSEYDINRFVDGQEHTVDFAKSVDDFKVKDVSVKSALELMLYQIIPNGVQYRLYKKEIFDNLRFPEGWIFEDVATVHKAFMKSNKIALVKTSIYAYRVRDDGIVKSQFSEKKMVVVPITQNLYREVCEFDEELKYAAASRAFAQNYHVFLQIPSNDKSNLKKVWNEMIIYRNMVIKDKNKNIRRKNKIGAISSIFGLNVAYWAGKLYLRIR